MKSRVVSAQTLFLVVMLFVAVSPARAGLCESFFKKFLVEFRTNPNSAGANPVPAPTLTTAKVTNTRPFLQLAGGEEGERTFVFEDGSTAALVTDRGMGEKYGHNEDSVAVAHGPNGERLFLVADGMGGHSQGEVASQVIIDSARQELMSSGDFNEAFEQAKQALLAKDEGFSNMGATIASAMINGNKLTTAHFGDAKAMVFRPSLKKFVFETKDHSAVQARIDLGTLTHEQAFHDKGRNVVTNSIAVRYGELDQFTGDAEINDFSLLPGDLVFVLSDGLMDLFRSEELEELLISLTSHQEPVNVEKMLKLIRTEARKKFYVYKDRSRDDNFTLIINQFL